MPERVQRVNELIKKELGQILIREADFPAGVLVTITRVDTSANIIESKIYVSVIPDAKKSAALNVLNKRVYHFQQLLNRRLKMRPIPKIHFVAEKETVRAGRIEAILEELKKEEK